MRFSATQAFAFSQFWATALAAPTVPVLDLLVAAELLQTAAIKEIAEGSGSMGLSPICTSLNTSDHGCIRYIKGFDITGVVTEVDLTFPQINDACDCIQACLNAPTTCASWVWKFSTPASVASGHRTCTLYSQFNLPANVTLVFDLNNSTNSNINAAEIVANGNEPQKGAPVAQTFMDANLNTTVDPDAVSGQVWQLASGEAIC